ncbi:MAG: SDR family NAD(P)-dependent oxidoreductase [Gammaproteobacteria bacterium]|nr:SDR family NAD(P)-dependent oxidoreductase [Gammaproteobacteria bacterium]
MDLQGKNCIVTGGASGIGAACSRAFAALDANVVIADVNDEGAQSVAGEFNGRAVHCDVGDEKDIYAAVAAAEEAFGPVDLFFSNAGVATGGDPLETDIQDWHDQWDTNVMAHVYAIRAVLPQMLDRGSGYFVHTASMAGILTTHGNVLYAATKHAVVAIAEWMSITYHDQGIHTSLLAPLGVNTPMLGNSGTPFARTAAGPIKEPEEVAEMVTDAIQNERFLILTDEIAQTWMDRKNSDLERWLNGMRRLQRKIDDAKQKGV